MCVGCYIFSFTIYVCRCSGGGCSRTCVAVYTLLFVMGRVLVCSVGPCAQICRPARTRASRPPVERRPSHSHTTRVYLRVCTRARALRTRTHTLTHAHKAENFTMKIDDAAAALVFVFDDLSRTAAPDSLRSDDRWLAVGWPERICAFSRRLASAGAAVCRFEAERDAM